MEKMIDLICVFCKEIFPRRLVEYNRHKDKSQFCSLSCAASYNNSIYQKGDVTHFGDKIQIKVLDEYSPFRYHLKNIKSHCKRNKKSIHVDLGNLKSQYDSQSGICPYTGWIMENTIGSDAYKNPVLAPNRASVDRIHSSGTYTSDNIEFVSYMANCAKNIFSKKDVIEFCQAVAANHPKSLEEDLFYS